jgi:hypothetical protein
VAQKLPQPLLAASKKGFSLPLREWFKDGAFTERLNSLEKIPFLSKKIIHEIISSNKSGIEDYGNFIWMLIVLNKTINSNILETVEN